MLMYPQCHLHSALFAIGMLALIFVHAMKYMHRANSPLQSIVSRAEHMHANNEHL